MNILFLALTLASQSFARPLFSTFPLTHLALREGAQAYGSGAGIGVTSGSDAVVIPVTTEPTVNDSAPTTTLAPEEQEESKR